MNKRVRVDELRGRTNTRDKSGCSKSTRIFSNFVATSAAAAAERAAFLLLLLPLSLSSFFRAPPIFVHAHVSRFSRPRNERYSADHE